jgi:class 3 adenylate cyclase
VEQPDADASQAERPGEANLSEDRVERRLAAILFADVVGYSALMGRDEAGTLARFNAHQHDLITPKIHEHRGRLIKMVGDGLLVEFPSAVEAVSCAVAIQRGMSERNAKAPENQRMVFRIGINVGDVIVQNGDILGDGVNVASRLEGVADPGGICISAAVHEQVEGKVDLGFVDGGRRALKNIARPIQVYQVRANSGADTPSRKPLIQRGPLWDDARSRFRANGEALGVTDDRRRVVLNNDPALWLKIGPMPDAAFHVYGPSIKTKVTQNKLPLLPMRFFVDYGDYILTDDGFGYSRTPPKNTFITDTVPFIFETGILWSVDTQVLKEFGTIPFIYSDIVRSFTNFTALLDRYLGVPLPLRWQIGMEQLQGRRISMQNHAGQWVYYGRECNVERIVKEGTYDRGDGPYASLRPFFDEILARCGLDPAQHMKGYPTDI